LLDSTRPDVKNKKVRAQNVLSPVYNTSNIFVNNIKKLDITSDIMLFKIKKLDITSDI
jgi:hypothetical protein